MLSPSFYPEFEMANYITRRYGTTLEPSTGDPGVDEWISSLEDSHVNRSAPRPVVETLPPTSGPKWPALSRSARLASCSRRTSQGTRSSEHGMISSSSDTAPPWPEFPPPQWVPRIEGRDGGYLPTLTTKANQQAKSMAKWPAYRRLAALSGGKTIPVAFWEWLMGLPVGYTVLDVSATQWFRNARKKRSKD